MKKDSSKHPALWCSTPADWIEPPGGLLGKNSKAKEDPIEHDQGNNKEDLEQIKAFRIIPVSIETLLSSLGKRKVSCV